MAVSKMNINIFQFPHLHYSKGKTNTSTEVKWTINPITNFENNFESSRNFHQSGCFVVPFLETIFPIHFGKCYVLDIMFQIWKKREKNDNFKCFCCTWNYQYNHMINMRWDVCKPLSDLNYELLISCLSCWCVKVVTSFCSLLNKWNPISVNDYQ